MASKDCSDKRTPPRPPPKPPRMAATLAPPQMPMSLDAVLNDHGSPPAPAPAPTIQSPADTESPVDSPKHHNEIMAKLTAKGAFKDKDLDKLTPTQEQELVEKIAEAFISCAVCAEIFYRPLTLQPCLHSYCGRCLKNWLKGQAARSQRRSCPSCREPIKGIRTDQMLVGLLVGWIKAHPERDPERDLTDADKRESDWAFSPGGGNASPPAVRVVPANTTPVPKLAVPLPGIERAPRAPKWENGLMYPEIYGNRPKMGTRSRSAQPDVSRKAG